MDATRSESFESILDISVLPQESEFFSQLQSLLMNLTEDSIPAAVTLLTESNNLTDPSRMQVIVHMIFMDTIYRFEKVHIYLKLIVALLGDPPVQKKSNQMSQILLNYLAKPANLANAQVYLLILCYNNKLFDSYGLLESVHAFYDGDYRMPTKWNSVLCWFAPIIEEHDQHLFEDCSKQYIHVFKHNFAPPKLKNYSIQFDSLQSNQWKDLKNSIGNNPNELAKILANDEITAFKPYFKKGFKINQRIPPSILECNEILLNEPTLVQYAAYYGSMNCFDYLVKNGANLDLLDKNKVSIAQFVAASGNVELLSRLRSLKCNLEGALNFAVLYHRKEVFDYLTGQLNVTILESDTQLGSVMHQAVMSDNIGVLSLCFNENVSVNSRDHDNKTPLHIAMINENMYSICSLLNHKDINVNAKDKNMFTPLHYAAERGFADGVRILLTCYKIGVNHTDTNGVFLIFKGPHFTTQL